MDFLRELWQRDKALVIVIVLGLLVLLWYIWKQNNQGQGTVTPPTTTSQTPTVASEQLATILADLGQLTPVTNSTVYQLPGVTNTSTSTITNAITNTVTNTQSFTPNFGLSNDTIRDQLILDAERKYWGPQNAAKLKQVIASIQKAYPRSGD
jgi:hypothetical protein